jgi:contact-dependent growth inhibition (CDI) system CdiI-like immunity protein
VTARPRTQSYPQLEAFFGGYLHEDFAEVHGDLPGAVAAFARDANTRERRALAREWRAFREDERHAATLAATRSAVGRLGAAWAPRRKSDLARLDRLIAALDPR